MKKLEKLKMEITELAREMVNNSELIYEGRYLLTDISYGYELNYLKKEIHQLKLKIEAEKEFEIEISPIDYKKLEIMTTRLKVVKTSYNENQKFKAKYR